MPNSTIKEYAKVSGVKLWQVAEAMGMQDSNFSKLLRHPLSSAQENEICAIIDKLSATNRKEMNHDG